MINGSCGSYGTLQDVTKMSDVDRQDWWEGLASVMRLSRPQLWPHEGNGS